jgi:hypothetical protein
VSAGQLGVPSAGVFKELGARLMGEAERAGGVQKPGDDRPARFQLPSDRADLLPEVLGWPRHQRRGQPLIPRGDTHNRRTTRSTVFAVTASRLLKPFCDAYYSPHVLRRGSIAFVVVAIVAGLLASAAAAVATPPLHFTVVVTRTGVEIDDLCSFPVRLDRPPGQTVEITDFLDYSRPGPDVTERFTNFINIFVNPANGKSVTISSTGVTTFNDLTINADGSYSYLATTVGENLMLDPKVQTDAGIDV